MNEILNRHRDVGRPKRDWPFWTALGGVTLLMIALTASLAYTLHLSYRHHTFVRDAAASFEYARSHGTLKATLDGEPVVIKSSQASDMLDLLVDVGMGRPNGYEPREDEGLLMSFGDGSSLQLCAVAIENGAQEEGLLVRHVRSDGQAYSYDTDKLKLGDLVRV